MSSITLSILTNVPAALAASKLGEHTAKLETTLERLSTGLRINRASDDAAGLSLAQRLQGDQAIAKQAIINGNEGLSLISVANSSLESISNILVRMSELATRARNGTVDEAGKSALNNEFQSLKSEIGRIASNSDYNGLNLFDEELEIAFQVGFDSTRNSQIELRVPKTSTEDLGIHGITDLTEHGVAAKVEDAMTQVAMLRGGLGAAESRLTVAVSDLKIKRDVFADAESVIRSADIALEAANLVRQRILRDGAAAVLGQANQLAQTALKLLT